MSRKYEHNIAAGSLVRVFSCSLCTQVLGSRSEDVVKRQVAVFVGGEQVAETSQGCLSVCSLSSLNQLLVFISDCALHST